MKLRKVVTLPLVALALGVAGCSAASYEERMKYLDEVSQKGIDYRSKLQEQKTEPSKDACTIGFDLLQAKPPTDRDGGIVTDTWRDQVKESYVKSCMTGELRPKPDPSGIDAVTPVPVSAPPPSSLPSAG
ncbi:hypothetical protein [Micromonospora sp. CV4]|uniref:hypothetical protein n=1 Tax=Micromonospora sp. CV4 TaxID=2478711 RepID=UPI000EF4BF2E|nr:hypothetical protein [Micromonospora sp. CV4]RLP93605.1 hypothetical protein EAD98_18610 [Micromonospora sp. CV4]